MNMREALAHTARSSLHVSRPTCSCSCQRGGLLQSTMDMGGTTSRSSTPSPFITTTSLSPTPSPPSSAPAISSSSDAPAVNGDENLRDAEPPAAWLLVLLPPDLELPSLLLLLLLPLLPLLLVLLVVVPVLVLLVPLGDALPACWGAGREGGTPEAGARPVPPSLPASDSANAPATAGAVAAALRSLLVELPPPLLPIPGLLIALLHALEPSTNLPPPPVAAPLSPSIGIAHLDSTSGGNCPEVASREEGRERADTAGGDGPGGTTAGDSSTAATDPTLDRSGLMRSRLSERGGGEGREGVKAE